MPNVYFTYSFLNSVKHIWPALNLEILFQLIWNGSKKKISILLATFQFLKLLCILSSKREDKTNLTCVWFSLSVM